jgi:hypothetical protein
MVKRNKLDGIVCRIKGKGKKAKEFTLFENDVDSIFIPLHKAVTYLLHCGCSFCTMGIKI